jgi:hypothetical protein
MKKLMKIPTLVELPDAWTATYEEIGGNEVRLIYKEHFANVSEEEFKLMGDRATAMMGVDGMRAIANDKTKTIEIIMRGPRKMVLAGFLGEIIGQYADNHDDLKIMFEAFKAVLPEKTVDMNVLQVNLSKIKTGPESEQKKNTE